MKRFKVRLILSALAFAVHAASQNAYAQSTTYVDVQITNASDGNAVRLAIQDAINKARSTSAAGVKIPAGQFNFAGTLKAIDGMHIMGAGRDQTRLIKTDAIGFPTHAGMIIVQCSTGRPFKFSGVTVQGLGRFMAGEDNYTNPNPTGVITDVGLAIRGACHDLQIFDSRFTHFTRAGMEIMGFGGETGVPSGLPTGVIYQNEFINNFYHGLGYGVAIGGPGLTAPWPSDEMGTNNAIFIENNLFERCRHSTTGNYGGKYVARYNRIANNVWPYPALDAHGENYVAGDAGRGNRTVELYENDLYFTDFQGTNAPHRPSWGIGIRGGAGVIFNNRTHYSDTHGILLTNDALNAYQTNGFYIWNNADVTTKTPLAIEIWDNAIVEGRQFVQGAKEGYKPYAYPHPLRTIASAPVVTTPPPVKVIDSIMIKSPTNAPILELVNDLTVESEKVGTDFMIEAVPRMNSGVTAVRFFLNGKEVAYDSAAPFLLTKWNIQLVAGTNTVRVQAYRNGAVVEDTSVRFTYRVSAPVKQVIHVEAELANRIVAPMVVVPNSSASGGRYIATPIGTNYASGYALYNITVPVSGTYDLRVRTLATSTSHDSITFQMDSGALQILAMPVSSQFQTVNLPLSFTLSAGVHVFRVQNHESATGLDWFELVPR